MRIKRFHTRKLIAMLISICIAATFLFSAWFIVSHADHDCIGHDCATCAQIHYCAGILHKLSASLCIIASSAWFLMPALLCAFLAAGLFFNKLDTPVKLKIRMNN